VTGPVPALVLDEADVVSLVVAIDPERTARDRMLREERSALLSVVVGDGLPRDRRRELHGEPVEDLRERLGQDDLDLALREDADAFDATDGAVLPVDALPSRTRVAAALGEPTPELGEPGDPREGCSRPGFPPSGRRAA
jgi:hypothetical protein